ncbi:MAG: DNA polymerase IV, partial [Thermocrispum sp.]
MHATVLHADLDAFFASVEQRDDPRLRGRPVIVGGGVVLAASYEARAYGVRGAMGGRRALQLCPQAIIVPPRMQAYVDASKAVFDVFRDTTPLVEGISIDEAFLDVSGLAQVSGTPVRIARWLRAEVRRRVGLPITVGVARTKSLAKVASAQAKPDGLLVVEPDGEEAFLHPLPVERLWGVGPVTSEKLHAMGMTTVGDLHRVSKAALVHKIGPGAGGKLHALANNYDPRPVVTRRRRGSIGSQRALGRRSGAGRRTAAELDTVLVGLVDKVGRRMRAADRSGRTVVLRLRFDDFSRATRSVTLPMTTANGDTMLAALRGLLATAMPLILDRGITLLGITVANLDGHGAVQLELPFQPGADGSVD